jgi:heavy metal sensor kinase
MAKRWRFWTLSLRVRLTAWYVLLLGFILFCFSFYLHFRLENTLQNLVEPVLVEKAAERLASETLMAVPFVLMGATLGGLFLANRALRPIDQITRTAQHISTGDLSQRISYRGPADEVGRLAQTFDQMLDRLQTGFEREKRFTADASHELRTPLTAIKGRIGMILHQPRTQEQYEEALSTLEQQVDRMIRLINDLLLLTRLDEKRLPWHPVSLDLSKLLEATVEQMRQLAEERQISLVEHIQPELFIQGDPDHLIRVFLNLLDNAIKYTPVKGQVIVQAESQGIQVCVQVRDTGAGILSEHLPHLFERFYRVEGARSRQTGGTGLGLAIAHELIRLNQGTLTAHSKINQGTTFIIIFPVLAREFPS